MTQGQFKRNAAGKPEPRGLYHPDYEHDSCGIGIVATLDGVPQHQEPLRRTSRVCTDMRESEKVEGFWRSCVAALSST